MKTKRMLVGIAAAVLVFSGSTAASANALQTAPQRPASVLSSPSCASSQTTETLAAGMGVVALVGGGIKPMHTKKSCHKQYDNAAKGCRKMKGRAAALCWAAISVQLGICIAGAS